MGNAIANLWIVSRETPSHTLGGWRDLRPELPYPAHLISLLDLFGERFPSP
jgi:hypothetical protein